MPSAALLERLRIDHPIIQAPMAGGMVTPALVAAVSNAGALGSFAAALISPEAMAEGVAAIRAATDRPFGVNLFVLDEVRADADAIARSHRLLRPIRDELGLTSDPAPAIFAHDG